MTETNESIRSGIPLPTFGTFEHSNFGLVSHFVFRATDFLFIHNLGVGNIISN
jgi:hypothetical protein